LVLRVRHTNSPPATSIPARLQRPSRGIASFVVVEHNMN